MESKKLSPFRFAQQIRRGEKLTEDEMKEFQPYLINRLYYFTGMERLTNFINMVWRIPKEMQYRLFAVFFRGIYPKNWIKSDKSDKEDELEVDFLKKKYQVSRKVARDYLKLLTPEDKKEIRNRFSS